MLKGFFSSIGRIAKKAQSNNEVTEPALLPGPDPHLTEVEITFLSMLEGKLASDSSVMGWWCSQNNVDGRRVIHKLHASGYLTLADYKFILGKAKVPALKEFLREHNLPIKGKKGELVNRIVENIDRGKCLAHFKESYWAYTPKAMEVLREQEAKAEAAYRGNIELIRRGQYEAFKRKMYPNTREHWGTEETFCETIDFIMKHGFEEFGLTNEIRRDISSFVAARAVNYNSRGYSGCVGYIASHLESLNLNISMLKIPDSLTKYAEDNEIGLGSDIIEVYANFLIHRSRAIADLSNYKRLGFRKVNIDSVACYACKRSSGKMAYEVNAAPILPRGWGCGCIYLLADL
jgi:hypothetical protein